MSNREPSLLRRIYPALALTGVGFGLVNVLDRPSPATSLAAGALAPTDGSATTVVPPAGAPATNAPPTSDAVTAQGQTVAPTTPAAPASTAAPAPAPTAAPVTAAPAPAAPAANDCGAIEKTGAAATIVHRREYGVIQVVAKFNSAKELCSARASYQTYDMRSERYESYAVPILNRQAESAHSANIQGVSGATAVSVAYQQSLQSAIDQL